MADENNVTIEYCTKCKFMMRSAWIAQELLQTFDGDLHEAALRPSLAPGIWQIFANGQLVWDRKAERGIPELKDLKRRVRDIIRSAHSSPPWGVLDFSYQYFQWLSSAGT